MSLEGKWVPIETQGLGADVYEKLQANPDGVIVGDDGYIYCMAPRENVDEGIEVGVETIDIANAPDVIHLRPVVQPLAIVPYVSTNQPLYQYNPNPSPPPQNVQSMAYEHALAKAENVQGAYEQVYVETKKEKKKLFGRNKK